MFHRTFRRAVIAGCAALSMVIVPAATAAPPGGKFQYVSGWQGCYTSDEPHATWSAEVSNNMLTALSIHNPCLNASFREVMFTWGDDALNEQGNLETYVQVIVQPGASVDWNRSDLGRLSRQYGWTRLADVRSFSVGDWDSQDAHIWRVQADGSITR